MIRILFVVILAALMILTTSCAAKSESETRTVQVRQIVPVTKAGRANLTGDLVLTAEFTPFQEVDLMSKVTGYVRTISVDIGDRVREAQPLAALEIPEMQDDLTKGAASVDEALAEVATATDELQRAQTSHELTHLSYARILDVSKKEPGLVPQQELDEAHSRDLVSEAQIATAKSSLRTAEQRVRVARADQGRSVTMQKYTTITAPFNGVVTKRYANLGTLVQAGSSPQAIPVVRLSQNDQLRLTLPVPESSVSRVRVGEVVDVRVPSIDRTFRGRVARTAEKVQSSTRTMDVEVDVPNPELTLVPGMYAEVSLRLDERPHVIALPPDALERSAAGAKVYSLSKDNRIHIVSVNTGLEGNGLVEIVSGLEEGALVVLGRRAGLKEGEEVEPKLAPEGGK
jgi:RND family efflux transporter MFP subunit